MVRSGAAASKKTRRVPVQSSAREIEVEKPHSEAVTAVPSHIVENLLVVVVAAGRKIAVVGRIAPGTNKKASDTRRASSGHASSEPKRAVADAVDIAAAGGHMDDYRDCWGPWLRFE